jgi:fructokinase
MRGVRGPNPLLAGVELGGTKCVCILGSDPQEVRERLQIPTTTPEETLTRIEAVLEDWARTQGPVAALGIACFGPLGLTPGSPGYGLVLSTPKPGWSHTEVASRLGGRLEVPVGFNTDVNGAARAENRWGAGRGLPSLVYITVGTGVGAGVLIGGRPVLGFSHPELGHLRVPRMPGDTWPGHCPYHGDCVEGLAAGPAIAARTGRSPAELPATDPVWDTVAFALGQLLTNLVLAFAPHRILVGGGVMTARPALFPQLRQHLAAGLNGYLEAPQLTSGLDAYVVPPGLGELAGPLGALALAADALDGVGRAGP